MRDRSLFLVAHVPMGLPCCPSPYGSDIEGSRVILQWVCVTAMGSRFLQWA